MPIRGSDGSKWPRHRAKASNKTDDRRRVIAATAADDTLAKRILNGLAQSGVHRVLVDLHQWKLLKWLDEPAPFFDWRGREAGAALVHPDDAPHMARMTIEFGSGATTGVLRLRATGGDYDPVE